MGTEETRALWRAASMRYYRRHGPAISLWKKIQQVAKKRGIIVPKLSDGELSMHTPMELLQLLRLPADLMTPQAYETYKAAIKQRDNPETCGQCGKPMIDNNPVHTKECIDYYEEKKKNERPEIN